MNLRACKPLLAQRPLNGILVEPAVRMAWPTQGKAMKTQTQRFLNLAAVRRWAGDLSYRIATNRLVSYGALILAASLMAGAVTKGHEELWRSAAALGIATVVIGLVHVWLDARPAGRSRRSHSRSQGKER